MSLSNRTGTSKGRQGWWPDFPPHPSPIIKYWKTTTLVTPLDTLWNFVNIEIWRKNEKHGAISVLTVSLKFAVGSNRRTNKNIEDFGVWYLDFTRPPMIKLCSLISWGGWRCKEWTLQETLFNVIPKSVISSSQDFHQPGSRPYSMLQCLIIQNQDKNKIAYCIIFKNFQM